MSWALTEGWAVVAGSLLRTAGTSAQAWAELTEYRDVLATIPEVAGQTLVRYLARFAVSLLAAYTGEVGGVLGSSLMEPYLEAWAEKRARLAKLARLTAVWAVLMAGSALVLGGAAIHLAVTYNE